MMIAVCLLIINYKFQASFFLQIHKIQESYLHKNLRSDDILTIHISFYSAIILTHFNQNWFSVDESV